VAYADSEEGELMRVVGRIMAVMCVASGTVAIPIVNMAVPVLPGAGREAAQPSGPMQLACAGP
jgi:hypothetical protein